MKYRLFSAPFVLLLLLPLTVAFAPHDDANNPKDIGNSTPAGIGGNGPWDSRNTILLSRLSLEDIGNGGVANVLGSDCWGWMDPIDGTEYAICGLTNGTSFVDISDPLNPRYLGKLPTQTGNSAWRDMKIFADHVFIVSDGNGSHGMQVFDLTQLRDADRENPVQFQNTAWYGGVTRCHNIFINEATGFAYLVGSNRAAGGLHIVDINNPASPVQAGNFSGDGYTHDVQVVVYDGPDAEYQGRELAFACNEDTVTIVDVTDKNNPAMISRNAYAQDEYTHQGWLSEDHRYFFMGDELDEARLGGPTRTHVFDCQDLDNVVYLGFFTGITGAIDHNMYIQDDLIYQANYTAGLRVLRIGESPTDLEEIAYFDTYNTDTATDFDGAWSCFPYFESGTVLINDRQNGMFLVRVAPIELILLDEPPSNIASFGQGEFRMRIDDIIGQFEPDSAVLHVDAGDGFQEFPMQHIESRIYEAVFPPIHCGQTVRYFVSAMATDGTLVCSPSAAPLEHYSAISCDGMTISFEDDFQSDQGWTVTGDAADGQWERGVPVGGGDRGDPPSDADGSGLCFLTDNQDGNSDVDAGTTILTSPIFSAIGPYAFDATLSYQRWYSNDTGSSPAADIFEVEVSNDGGESWVNLETVGPGGREVSGGWEFKSFRLAEVLELTNQMCVRFIASDLDDGSVVEAAVDHVKLTLINCARQFFPRQFQLENGEIRRGNAKRLFSGNPVGVQCKTTSDPTVPMTAQLAARLNTTNPELLYFTSNFQITATDQPVLVTLQLLNIESGEFESIGQQWIQPASPSSASGLATGDLSRFMDGFWVTARIQFDRSDDYSRAIFIRISEAQWLVIGG